MNIVLWIFQIVLAFLAVPGGAFKVFMFDQVATEVWFGALPRGAWSAIGVFEVVCGVLLVVPMAMNGKPTLTRIAAAALTVEAVLLAGLYGSYSTRLSADNPLVFAVAMGVLAVVVAFGRSKSMSHAH